MKKGILLLTLFFFLYVQTIVAAVEILVMMSPNMILEDNCEVVFSRLNDPISSKEEITENTFDSIIASARWDLKFEDICTEN